MPVVSNRDPAYVVDDREPVVTEYEDSYSSASTVVSTIARFVAVAAAAVLTIVGLVAIARIDWDAGMDAASVRVYDRAFTPEVAIAAVVLGVIGIAIAASPLADLRLAYGAILVAIGVAILLLSGDSNDLELADGHGWLVLGVGAVIALSGLFRSYGFARRHTVAERPVERPVVR
jgi:hypothetical protein